MAAALRRQPKGKFIYTVPGNSSRNSRGIGGNQGAKRTVFDSPNSSQHKIVCIETYNISKTSSRNTDIYWKASRHAVGEYGYQDGFGITYG